MEMMLNDHTVLYGVLYVLIYRLAIITLGGLSIYLGYRLFATTDLSTPTGKSVPAANEVTAQFSENMRLSVKKAAPGTFFSLFGASIVIFVLAQNPPEFKHVQATDGAGEVQVRGSDDKVRPGQDDEDQAVDFERRHRAIWLQMDDLIEAAQRLTEQQEDNPAYWETLAALRFANNNAPAAVDAQQRAVALSGSAKKTLRQQQLTRYQAAVAN